MKLLSAMTVVLAIFGIVCTSAHATQVYGLDLYPGNKLVSFDASTPGTQTTIKDAFTPPEVFGMDTNPEATIMYGIDSDKQFGTIDKMTGTFTQLSTLSPVSGSITGLKIDPTSGTFYVSTSDLSTSYLYTLNPVTGAASLVGSQSVAPCIIEIAIDLSGNMYATDIVNDAFYRMDKATGMVTLIGTLGYDLNYAQGMDFDYSTGKLYAALYEISSSVTHFSTIDLATGQATEIANLGTQELEIVIDYPANSVPEPSTFLLLGAGLGGLALLRKKSKK